jgi:hypothetical protein
VAELDHILRCIVPHKRRKKEIDVGPNKIRQLAQSLGCIACQNELTIIQFKLVNMHEAMHGNMPIAVGYSASLLHAYLSSFSSSC